MDFVATDVREEGAHVVVTGRLGDEWGVTALVEHKSGPPQLVGLNVHRANGESALTTEVLRAVPFAHLMAAANTFLTGGNPTFIVVPSGGRGYDEHDYAQWALRYVRFVNAGSRRPVADLAEDAGMKPSVVRDLIHTCREKGMLPKSRPGLAGGPLTEKARRLLGMEED
jgi:hypothetical protein